MLILILIFRLIKKNIIKNFNNTIYFFLFKLIILYIRYILYIFIVFFSIHHGTYRSPLALLRVFSQSSMPPFPKRSVWHFLVYAFHENSLAMYPANQVILI